MSSNFFFSSESQIINTSQKRRRSARLSRKSISSYEELTASDGKENAAVLSIQIDLPPPSKDGNLKRLANCFFLVCYWFINKII